MDKHQESMYKHQGSMYLVFRFSHFLLSSIMFLIFNVFLQKYIFGVGKHPPKHAPSRCASKIRTGCRAECLKISILRLKSPKKHEILFWVLAHFCSWPGN